MRRVGEGDRKLSDGGEDGGAAPDEAGEGEARTGRCPDAGGDEPPRILS
jgi:hypothetical protein